MKKQITEEDKLHLGWYKQARKSMTKEEIDQFTSKLFNDYQHDYGTQCHAIAASTLAHLHNLLYEHGATGMQASFATWEIIKDIFNIKAGAKLVNYDKMLYPQYEQDFNEKKISKYTFEALQEKAKESLKDFTHMSPIVKQHMQYIVDGIVPFGYELDE